MAVNNIQMYKICIHDSHESDIDYNVYRRFLELKENVCQKLQHESAHTLSLRGFSVWR